MPDLLEYRHQGRNKRTFGALLFAGVVLLGLQMVGTAGWILVFLFLFAVPAIIDILLNPQATFSLDTTHMRWKGVLQEGAVPLDEITLVRMDTRWDVSVRVTLNLTDGKNVRLPQDVAPPNKLLEAALADRGIKTERHHFRVI